MVIESFASLGRDDELERMRLEIQWRERSLFSKEAARKQLEMDLRELEDIRVATAQALNAKEKELKEIYDATTKAYRAKEKEVATACKAASEAMRAKEEDLITARDR